MILYICHIYLQIYSRNIILCSFCSVLWAIIQHRSILSRIYFFAIKETVGCFGCLGTSPRALHWSGRSPSPGEAKTESRRGERQLRTLPPR